MFASVCAIDYVLDVVVLHQVFAIGSQVSTQIDVLLVLRDVGDEICATGPVLYGPALHSGLRQREQPPGAAGATTGASSQPELRLQRLRVSA